MTRAASVVLSTMMAVLAVSCATGPQTGPPAIRLGIDVCDGCGMTVSEERHAAASRDTGGEHAAHLFDDIGCLARYATRPDAPPPGERFVHDYGTGAWIAVSSATFVRGNMIATPMGSGVAAFGDAGDADALAAERGAARISWDQIEGMARAGTLHAGLESDHGEDAP